MIHSDYAFKILLIGDSQTGKSSIIQRFTEKTFTKLYVSKIGFDLKIKTVQIDDFYLKLQIVMLI